jgi:hypothetical protein
MSLKHCCHARDVLFRRALRGKTGCEPFKNLAYFVQPDELRHADDRDHRASARFFNGKAILGQSLNRSDYGTSANRELLRKCGLAQLFARLDLARKDGFTQPFIDGIHEPIGRSKRGN